MNMDGGRKAASIVRVVSLVVVGMVLAPPPVLGQSVGSLQKQIKKLQNALDAVKKQLNQVQKEQSRQKTQMARQKKEIAPLQKTVKRLSKVSISGGATGIIQGTFGVPSREGGDDTFAGGSFDLIFEYNPMKDWKVVLDLEAIGGNGPEQNFTTLHGLNGDLGTTNDNVTILEAYLEGVLFNKRLTLSAGKIDATNYIDGNAYGGDETSQFLSSGFLNNSVFSAPGNGPGVRARLDLISDRFYLEVVGMSQDPNNDTNTTDRIFEDVFGAVEVGVTPKLFGRPGNYRLWGTFDGAGSRIKKSTGRAENYTAMGVGLSFDQEVAKGLGLFFRLGYRDSQNTAYTTRSAWSIGAQLNVGQFVQARPKDVIGIAWGEISPTKRDFGRRATEEDLVEAYYNWFFTDNFQLSGIFQFINNRNGNSSLSDVTVVGARVQANF